LRFFSHSVAAATTFARTNFLFVWLLFLTIVWRSNELKVEAEAAENSNKVGALEEI